jgi:hypothetical protein
MGHYSGGKYVYDFGDEGNGLCERASNSSASVNDERIAELEKALKDIKKHQELVSGQMGVTWHIADRALNK